MFNGFTVIVIQKLSKGFLAMPRTKYRSLRRPVTSRKRSRKPKENNDDGESSISSKKIRLDESSSSHTTTSALRIPTGYRFQDVAMLGQIISKCAVCNVCLKGSLRLLEKPGGCGLAKTMLLQCSNSSCDTCTELPTSQRVVKGKGRFYDVNRRVTLAMRVIGKERSALVKFCAVMDMPGPAAKKSYNTHVKAISRVSQEVAEYEMKKAAKELRAKSNVGKHKALDIAVSCDGTWARRGFQSLYGMVSAIEIDSGKVLDFEVKSKVCYQCRSKKHLDPDSEEYNHWMETHGPKCNANFDRSAKAMEAAGAVGIWQRSLEKHNLRYVDFVGDGDSSSHRDVVRSDPYGDVEVQKIECVGHIQKRMGGRLRKKKRDLRNTKLSDGKTIGGRNRLTDNLIDMFQRYYGKALRENKGNIDGMERAVKAIWHHYASTKDKQMHQYCPEGENSWCGWQKDKVLGTKTFQPKNIAPAVMKEILTVFQGLCE